MSPSAICRSERTGDLGGPAQGVMENRTTFCSKWPLHVLPDWFLHFFSVSPSLAFLSKYSRQKIEPS